MLPTNSISEDKRYAFEYCCTLLLGFGFLCYTVRFVLLRSRLAARQLLNASIVYLPLELLIFVLGKG
jgi:heme O synthase-like polyprenyltransferase